jgi:membrane-bound inhibitor of C-type lysozyme
MKKIFWIMSAVILLAGCSVQKDATKEQVTNEPSDMAVIYNCQKQEVKVDFNNAVEPQTAQLFFTGKAHENVILPLVMSASGAKYSDGVITFWTHQGEATLMMESDGKNIVCTQQNMTADESVITDNNGNVVMPGCKTWFDGCNTCTVSEDGKLSCAKKYCASELMQKARCMDES